MRQGQHLAVIATTTMLNERTRQLYLVVENARMGDPEDPDLIHCYQLEPSADGGGQGKGPWDDPGGGGGDDGDSDDSDDPDDTGVDDDDELDDTAGEDADQALEEDGPIEKAPTDPQADFCRSLNISLSASLNILLTPIERIP